MSSKPCWLKKFYSLTHQFPKIHTAQLHGVKLLHIVILRIMHLLKGFEFLFSLDGMQCKATEQERKGF